MPKTKPEQQQMNGEEARILLIQYEQSKHPDFISNLEVSERDLDRLIQAAKIVGAAEERERLLSELDMPIESTGLFGMIKTSLEMSESPRTTSQVARQWLRDIINNEDDKSN